MKNLFKFVILSATILSSTCFSSSLVDEGSNNSSLPTTTHNAQESILPNTPHEIRVLTSNNSLNSIELDTSEILGGIKNILGIAYVSEDNYNLMTYGSKTILDCISYDIDSFPTVKSLIDRIKRFYNVINIFITSNPNLEFGGAWEVESRSVHLSKAEISTQMYPYTLMFELCNASNPFIALGTAKKFSINEDHYAFFSEAIEHISLVTSTEILKEYLQYTLRNSLPNTNFYDAIQSSIECLPDEIFINHWQELKLTNIKHVDHYKAQYKKKLGIDIFPSLSKLNDNDCQFLITSALSELSLDIAKKESQILKILFRD